MTVCIDPPLAWILGLSGSAFVFLFIIAVVLYKNWVYEQELDSLLWKIDVKDIIASDVSLTSKTRVCLTNCLTFSDSNQCIRCVQGHRYL